VHWPRGAGSAQCLLPHSGGSEHQIRDGDVPTPRGGGLGSRPGRGPCRRGAVGAARRDGDRQRRGGAGPPRPDPRHWPLQEPSVV